jgi:acetyl-CoA synthetase
VRAGDGEQQQDVAGAGGALRDEIVRGIRTKIGPIATPDVVLFVDDLPKTRSGKIVRRVLRKIAGHLEHLGQKKLEPSWESELGDLSTVANPGVIDDIIRKISKADRKN